MLLQKTENDKQKRPEMVHFNVQPFDILEKKHKKKDRQGNGSKKEKKQRGS